jgi:hypothetical protein
MNEVQQREYIFTFEEGGWNTVWASTKQNAIDKAIKEYEYTDKLNPIVDSVRLANKDVLQAAMSTFY